MNEILPIVAIALSSRDRKRRNRVIESALPALVPGPAYQRAAMTAVIADNQARDEERDLRRAEDALAEEAAAVADAIAQRRGEKLTDAELAAFPELSRVVERRPELRAKFVRPAPPPDGNDRAGVRAPADALPDGHLSASQSAAKRGASASG